MTARTRLTGLAATLALAALVVGVPALLVAIGANPIPDTVPTWQGIWQGLTTRDDGTLFLAVITIAAWAAWAFLTAAVLLEAIASLRGLHAPTLPGLSLPQNGAQALIGAAVLLFAAPLTTPATATPRPAVVATAAQHTPHPAPHAAPAPRTAPTTHTPSAPRTTPATHTVSRGESLWSIAHDHLGDGDRYDEIYALNKRVLGDKPSFVATGTVLTLPAAGLDQPTAARHYTVRTGDTLSGIAADQLGDADRYPEIYQASRAIEQPGGVHLRDPDVIDIGWTLALPGHATPANTTSTRAPANPAPAKTAPAPAQDAPPGRADTPPPSPASSAATTHASTTQAPSTQAPASTIGPDAPAAQDQNSLAPWVLAGLAGGPVLVGGLFLMLRRRRANQFRHRRPGHTITTPPPLLAPVEKTLTTLGAQAAPTIEHLHDALLRLATGRAHQGQPMPALAAVQLTGDAITVHLSAPDTLPDPWQGSQDQLRWRLPAGIDTADLGPLTPDQPAPYPLLVTVGTTEAGEPFLLNCEDLDLGITGDPTYASDFARYIAAEIACTPWSGGVTVDCVGVATEAAGINPDRIHAHHEHDPAAEILADTVTMIERAHEAGQDLPTARAHLTGADTWPARMLLIDAHTQTTPAAQQLITLVRQHPGATGTSIVLNGVPATDPGVSMTLTSTGRVRLEHVGLDLVAVGLTSDEAQGCAALIGQAGDLTGAPIPIDVTIQDGWQSFTDAAGALRTEHTTARAPFDEHHDDGTTGDAPAPAPCLLQGRDNDYLATAATTAEDLATLSPRVNARVRRALHDVDPTLDEDLAAWFDPDCPLPRLTLLGHTTARTRGKPLTERKAYMTEVLAFIATRPHGASTDEIATAMNINTAKVREYARVVREWLGTNPRTGSKHLPDARHAPETKTRGVSVYQVIDLLTDADLFRRLRARGQAAGPDGITDLVAALTLVQGRPFGRGRMVGWAWVAEGDRLDHHLTCAIVDVAHLLTTHALHAGDTTMARSATQTALLAAPEEEIPRLDLARIAAAEGDTATSQRILHHEVYNRSDDDGPPTDLPARTEHVLDSSHWTTSDRASRPPKDAQPAASVTQPNPRARLDSGRERRG